MAYVLNSTTLKRPDSMVTDNEDAITTNISISGTVGRDWFFDKNIYKLSWDIINTTDLATIQTIYSNYKSGGVAIRFQLTDTNMNIDKMVHMDISAKGYKVPGENYLAGFAITLTEK